MVGGECVCGLCVCACVRACVCVCVSPFLLFNLNVWIIARTMSAWSFS